MHQKLNHFFPTLCCRKLIKLAFCVELYFLLLLSRPLLPSGVEVELYFKCVISYHMSSFTIQSDPYILYHNASSHHIFKDIALEHIRHTVSPSNSKAKRISPFHSPLNSRFGSHSAFPLSDLLKLI